MRHREEGRQQADPESHHRVFKKIRTGRVTREGRRPAHLNSTPQSTRPLRSQDDKPLGGRRLISHRTSKYDGSHHSPSFLSDLRRPSPQPRRSSQVATLHGIHTVHLKYMREGHRPNHTRCAGEYPILFRSLQVWHILKPLDNTLGWSSRPRSPSVETLPDNTNCAVTLCSAPFPAKCMHKHDGCKCAKHAWPLASVTAKLVGNCLRSVVANPMPGPDQCPPHIRTHPPRHSFNRTSVDPHKSPTHPGS